MKFIHLNDSKMDIGSRFDIHEHIGLGKIGIGGIKNYNQSQNELKKIFVRIFIGRCDVLSVSRIQQIKPI